MTSIYGSEPHVISAVAGVTAADKLRFAPPFACVVQRWGVTADPAITGGTMDAALDVIPKSGGTRVNGSVSGGFDVAGGSMTNFDVAVGTGKYHEPVFDPSETVLPGTGVSKHGNQLLLVPGDQAIIEVTGAGTGGANTTFWIEYRPISFQSTLHTAFVSVAS